MCAHAAIEDRVGDHPHVVSVPAPDGLAPIEASDEHHVHISVAAGDAGTSKEQSHE